METPRETNKSLRRKDYKRRKSLLEREYEICCGNTVVEYHGVVAFCKNCGAILDE